MWASAQRLTPIVDRLSRSGFGVFTFNYGRDEKSAASRIPGAYATAPTTESSRQLAAFINYVRSRTGAGRVDLVGHSQGGVVIRSYLAEHGGALVDQVVTLGSPITARRCSA